jgi:hypothetical protein
VPERFTLGDMLLVGLCAHCAHRDVVHSLDAILRKVLPQPCDACLKSRKSLWAQAAGVAPYSCVVTGWLERRGRE